MLILSNKQTAPISTASQQSRNTHQYLRPTMKHKQSTYISTPTRQKITLISYSKQFIANN